MYCIAYQHVTAQQFISMETASLEKNSKTRRICDQNGCQQYIVKCRAPTYCQSLVQGSPIWNHRYALVLSWSHHRMWKTLSTSTVSHSRTSRSAKYLLFLHYLLRELLAWSGLDLDPPEGRFPCTLHLHLLVWCLFKSVEWTNSSLQYSGMPLGLLKKVGKYPGTGGLGAELELFTQSELPIKPPIVTHGYIIHKIHAPGGGGGGGNKRKIICTFNESQRRSE